MRISTLTSFPKVRSLALLIATAGLLAGCQTSGPETTGSIGATAQSAQAAAEPAKGEPAKYEPPMTRSKAAMECWMKTEKGSASVNIDKRADVVTKCIDDKLKSAAAAPKG